jgi:hypothetical protein
MKAPQALTHEFVEFVPRELRQGVLYVSIPYATVIHMCCCGCGQQVVTPLAPSQWTLSFDGKSISLHPSVGNWNFPCRSHYWIRNNQVLWAKQWTKAQIAAGQHLDAKAVRDEFAAVQPATTKTSAREKVESSSPRKGLLAKFKSIFGK